MKRDQAFRCISLCPIALAYPGIAISTARAGGIGLLDLEFSERGPADRGKILRLIGATDGDIGLRLCGVSVESVLECLRLLGERPHWIVLSSSGAAKTTTLPPIVSRRVLVEVHDLEDLTAIDGLNIDGIIAKGHEAGGWVGQDTTFILAQKLLKQTSLPVYLQGGIGVYNTAACRVAGSAGVVLDDQLLLMPESAFPRPWRSQISNLTGQESRTIGDRLGWTCRVLVRPGFAGADRLQRLAKTCEVEHSSREQWRQQAREVVGWGDPSACAWPIGQDIGFAATFRERYQTTGRLIQALLKSSLEHIEIACALKPLAPGAPLAVSQGTRYPIVQGPMTRVSDTAEFANAVAHGGALPFLALGLMRGDKTLELLQKTRARLGTLPWGVGVIGFVPQKLRDQQLTAIWQIKPSFALIAGGRPDQASEFERQGIPAYIHVPSPALLTMFLEEGATQFVFEGRECGGHVGPLTSFVLWETMIRVLIEKVPKGSESLIHVLFAGGIHDALSAAMVSAMAAPLAERGMRVGVLMGSAYLFTEEIVTSGAVVRGFQTQALACRRTINLETGPGHATRCAVSPFAQKFYAERQRLISEGYESDEVRDRLEDLNLGRLRIASKGKARLGEDGVLVDVDDAAQLKDGMYMIGQVATLKERIISIAQLHNDVSENSAAALRQARKARPASIPKGAPSNIAVIGIGTLLPKASSPGAYWYNIVHKVNAITEVPKSRWDWRLYFDEDRRKRDKIYSKWGGFLDEVVFDPLRFGIPPNSLKSIDPIQLLALEVVRRALEDAGYADGNFDREQTSVILGASGGLGDLGLQYGVRSEIPRFVDVPSDEIWDRLPDWTEESFAGSLLNVVAGRVANRFDFGGLNFTVDAACASSLAAINLAVNELGSGRSNMVIAGGVDTVQSPFGYLCFSKTQALSPRGRVRTFDEHGDGIVISEGAAIVVLKRLADAERDGDRIYAVIKAVAGSSDGKALGVTAPLPEGQMRALRTAYAKAGFSPSTLGFIEAHGTGTPVGDRAETETVVRTLKNDNTPSKSCAIGSVKTLIGHTKATAGVAGLIKVALALHHKVLPAHDGVETPITPIADEQSPVFLLKETRPWFAHPDHPRRGAVSAFGFGGTNFHSVLEEYDREFRPCGAPLGANNWPCELLVLRARDLDSFVRDAHALLKALDEGADPQLHELAYSLALRASGQHGGGCCLAVVADSTAHYAKLLKDSLGKVDKGDSGPLAPTVHFGLDAKVEAREMVFLFPGQGAQYPNMAREATLYCAELRAAVEHADRHLRPTFDRLLSQYVYPSGPFSEVEEQRNRKRLTDTRIAQPAIGAIEAGFLDFATRLGLKPAMTAGHSYGEYAALHAAGVLSRDDFLLVSETRGRVMAEAGRTGECGAMAAVNASRAEVSARLDRFVGVIVANHNAPQQSVISGPAAAVQAALEELSGIGISVLLLPVGGAFHTELIAAAQEPLAAAIKGIAIAPPRIPVYSNTTAHAYPMSPAAIRAQLIEHLLKPVEFVQQIETMYAAGARIFIELGPKSILTGLVGQILEGHEHLAVSLDGEGGRWRDVLTALAALIAAGVELDLPKLFDGEVVRELDLARLTELTRPAPVAATAWFISGGCARPPGESQLKTGTLPALTLETVQATREARLTRSIPPKVAPVSADLVAHAIPAPTLTKAEPAVTAPWATEALQSYQQTMRQFLALQEQVMERFLVGLSPAVAPVAAVHASDDTETQVARAPVPEEPASGKSPSVGQVDAERAGLTRVLLEVASERTGYPADMIGVEQDLEAVLGMDSICRVEILGALQKRLPEVLAARVRERMERVSRIKTLDGIVTEVLCGVSEAPRAATKVAAEASAAAKETPSRGEVLQVLLEVVSERTGYPADMIGVEQDLEAELGMDSICRVEILGTLQKRLPEVLAARVRERMERVSRIKTLDGIVSQLLQGGDAAAHGDQPTDARRLPRYVMRAIPKAIASGLRARLEGLYLITEDRLGVAREVAAALRIRSAEAETIALTTLSDPQALAAYVVALREGKPPIFGIIDLAHLDPNGLPETLEAWREANARKTKGLFALLKHLAPDLQSAGARGQGIVLGASLLGGCFGRDRLVAQANPAAGAALGLLKTLAAEWPGVRARALDFDTTLGAVDVARCIIHEIAAHHETVEIGYPGGVRTVFKTMPAEFQDETGPGVEPEPDWVVLITAGARGITHQIARELARPSMKFIIAGRAPEPASDADASGGIDDLPSLRRIFIEAAWQRGEVPTPVAIDGQINDLLCAREIRQNLAYLRGQGLAVEYAAVDVRDEQAFGALIEDVYDRYGRIDAVVHGAGIIEDKLIVDKPLSSFERVFDTKVDSTFILSRYLRPDSLRLLVFFTSVAGRYGNRGQSDYAASNEVVNRFAWWLECQWPNTRVVAINWGPWDAAGMASDGVKRQFRERGIVPIAVPEGRRFFSDELRYGRKGEVEVIAGVGPWDAFDRAASRALGEGPHVQRGGIGFLLRAPVIHSNGSVTLVHEFSLLADPYLSDHVLDGKPVLPAAGAIEWIGQFVQAAWPDRVVTDIQDLRVLKGFVLEDGASRRALFRARASSHADAEALKVIVELLDPDTQIAHYRASAILRSQVPEASQAEILPLETNETLDPNDAYRKYLFHGERFRLLRGITSLSRDGIDAFAVPSEPRAWIGGSQPFPNLDDEEFWLFDPGLVDTAPQLGIVWSRVTHGSTALPSRFGAIARYGTSRRSGPMQVVLRVDPRSDEHTLIYDAFFIDRKHEVRLHLRDVKSISSTAFNRLAAAIT